MKFVVSKDTINPQWLKDCVISSSPDINTVLSLNRGFRFEVIDTNMIDRIKGGQFTIIDDGSTKNTMEIQKIIAEVAAEVERTKTPRQRRFEEFAKLDRLDLFKWSEKDLAAWQSRHETDEPGWRLAECEWQRRTTKEVVSATLFAARWQAYFGIAGVVIGVLAGAIMTLVIQLLTTPRQ